MTMSSSEPLQVFSTIPKPKFPNPANSHPNCAGEPGHRLSVPCRRPRWAQPPPNLDPCSDQPLTNPIRGMPAKTAIFVVEAPTTYSSTTERDIPAAISCLTLAMRLAAQFQVHTLIILQTPSPISYSYAPSPRICARSDRPPCFRSHHSRPLWSRASLTCPATTKT